MIPRRGKLSLPAVAVVVVTAGGAGGVGGAGGGGGGTVATVAGLTTMLKAANWVFMYPSVTVIAMFEYVPTLLAVGVPDNRPVAVLKLAQDGAFATANAIFRPLGSVAAGWKE